MAGGKGDGSASDIPASDWIDRCIPAPLRPYLRLARIDRPIGIWLLMLPCWWSTALASPGWPDPWFLLLFASGAAIMRGAGCTMNDIADRDFDARVARTAARPLPSGAISVRAAVVFMAALCLAGLAVLLQFNTFAVILGASSLLLVAAYPFAKRVTDWPQAVLGLTFNWGALLGWAAVHGDIDWPAVALYAAGLAWTLGYDTIYAHQDKEDDAITGVRSTALRLGAATKPWLCGFYAAAIALLALAGGLADVGWAFWPALAAVALHFFWQIARLDIDDAKRCLAVFKSNAHVGLLVFAAIVVGRVAG
ncbi:MAG TPA: 4-hydroxybenzoate octaprenyltransferase [Rhodospirillales bacterium]|nr:4-hydroxybenzoate octaprenyltransferase [Rhodospirillales bacterium]